MAEAKLAKSVLAQTKAAGQAQDANATSLDYWRKIPSASRLGPTVFRVSSETYVLERLAECRLLLAAQ
jgi:hypothetical protein